MGPAGGVDVVLEGLDEETTLELEEAVVGELLPAGRLLLAEELPGTELIAASRVTVTVAVTVTIGAVQLVIALDTDELNEVDGEIVELELDRVDGVEEPEEVLVVEEGGTELDVSNDEAGGTEDDVLDVDEETLNVDDVTLDIDEERLLVLVVDDTDVLEVTTIE